MKTAIPYTPITEEREKALERELSRLRQGIMDCDETELNRRHARMSEIKAECACNWDSRVSHAKGERLAGMGY